MKPAQLRTIHMAKRAAGLTDQSYRTLLWNVGGVESSKDLGNAGLEDVMAVLEDMGFDGHPAGPRYWRNKVVRRGQCSSERMVRKIYALAAEQRYQLPALCRRMSLHRTDQVEQLCPKEAWNLIEALKAIVGREAADGSKEKETEVVAHGTCNTVTDDAGDDVPF